MWVWWHSSEQSVNRTVLPSSWLLSTPRGGTWQCTGLTPRWLTGCGWTRWTAAPGAPWRRPSTNSSMCMRSPSPSGRHTSWAATATTTGRAPGIIQAGLEFRQMWHIHLGTGMFGIPTMKDLRTILSTCKGNITKLPLQEFLKMQQYWDNVNWNKTQMHSH